MTTAGRYMVSPHACFACGELNEHGLHLVLHVDGEMCWTELTLRPEFQGWEGIAHGGIVATILDEVMGWALAAADAWGHTAKMSIAYKRPVPVGTRIRGEGRLVEDAGPQQALLVLARGHRVGHHPAAHAEAGEASLAVGQDGRVFVADTGNDRIQVMNSAAEHCLCVGRERAMSRPLADVTSIPQEMLAAVRQCRESESGMRLHDLELGGGHYDCTLQPGERLRVTLHKGEVGCDVIDIRNGDD